MAESRFTNILLSNINRKVCKTVAKMYLKHLHQGNCIATNDLVCYLKYLNQHWNTRTKSTGQYWKIDFKFDMFYIIFFVKLFLNHIAKPCLMGSVTNRNKAFRAKYKRKINKITSKPTKPPKFIYFAWKLVYRLFQFHWLISKSHFYYSYLLSWIWTKSVLSTFANLRTLKHVLSTTFKWNEKMSSWNLKTFLLQRQG